MRIDPARSLPPLTPRRAPAPEPPPAPPWSPAQRPATLVERRADGSLRLDGVRWGFEERGEPAAWPAVFATTTVDPSRVKKVYLFVEPFAPAPIAAHTRLMFEMQDDAPVTASGGRQDRGIYVSFEARLHEGESYDPIRGLGRAYRPIYQVGTWSDALQRKTRKTGQPVVRYELKLDDTQKSQLLRNCLQDALSDHGRQWYNTASNSCYDVSMRQLDSVLTRSQRIPEYKLDGRINPFMLAPRNAPSVLLNHHLLASPVGISVTPDATRYPQATHPPSALSRIAGAVGRLPAIRPITRLAAGLGGALAGAMIGGPLAAVALGLAGQWVGRGLGNLLLLQGNLQHEPSEKWFPVGSAPPCTTSAPAAPGGTLPAGGEGSQTFIHEGDRTWKIQQSDAAVSRP